MFLCLATDIASSGDSVLSAIILVVCGRFVSKKKLEDCGINKPVLETEPSRTRNNQTLLRYVLNFNVINVIMCGIFLPG